MKLRATKIVTKEGVRQATLLFSRGQWGVTREVGWHNDYEATHLPTGMRVSRHQPLNVVLALVKALEAGVEPFDLSTFSDELRAHMEAIVWRVDRVMRGMASP